MVYKLSVCTLMIINFIFIVNGFNVFMPGHKEFEDGQHETEIKCANIKPESIAALKDETICKPRKILMKLSLNNEYTYYPDMIPLVRCHGHCKQLSCLPSMKKMTNITLQRNHLNSASISCVTVNVEEHTQCKCGCEVMKEHCNSKQRYVERNCQCKCINKEEKELCKEKTDMMWDSRNCKCVCNKMEETCSSDLIWIPEKCACAKVMMVGDELINNKQ